MRVHVHVRTQAAEASSSLSSSVVTARAIGTHHRAPAGCTSRKSELRIPGTHATALAASAASAAACSRSRSLTACTVKAEEVKTSATAHKTRSLRVSGSSKLTTRPKRSSWIGYARSSTVTFTCTCT